MTSRTAAAQYALSVMAGRVDLADPGTAARLAVMKVRHPGDHGLRCLIDRASAVHAAAMEHDPLLSDAAYLRAVAAGVVDLLNDPVWQRLEPIHARYERDAEMMALFETAATAFADAAVDAAAAVLAGPAAVDVISKARQIGHT